VAVAVARGLPGSMSVMMKKKKSPWQATEAAVDNGVHVRVGIT
jgi:hypothetical protein